MRVGDVVDVAELISISRRVRAHILRMSAVAKAPHVGSALSCADILVALYFHAARVAPEKPDDPERDIVILSKGHGSAALYSYATGIFPPQPGAETFFDNVKVTPNK